MGLSCSAGVAGREPATLFSVGVTGRDVRGTGVGTLRGTGVGTRGGGVGRRGGSRTVEAIKFVSLCRPSATSNTVGCRSTSRLMPLGPASARSLSLVPALPSAISSDDASDFNTVTSNRVEAVDEDHNRLVPSGS